MAFLSPSECASGSFPVSYSSPVPPQPDAGGAAGGGGLPPWIITGSVSSGPDGPEQAGNPWPLIGSVPKGTDGPEQAGSPWLLNRRCQYQLQDHLFEILPIGARERACHRVSGDVPKKPLSVVVNDAGRARLANVYHCGNPWICPVCAPVIAARRASEIGDALRCADSEGFRWLKLAFTCAHTKDDSLQAVLDLQVQALRRFKACRSVSVLRASVGYVDSITAKEVTWSSVNGWHPHQHEYWMCNLPSDFDLGSFRAELESEWIAALEAKGLSGKPGVALYVGVMQPTEIDNASGYLAKSGIAAGYLAKSVSAVVSSHKPDYKAGHMTPLELLSVGAAWSDSLFLDFWRAFKGRKQIVMGNKIVRAYRGFEVNKLDGDSEIVKKAASVKSDETEVCQLGKGELKILRYQKRLPAFLELIENDGVDKALEYLELCIETYRESEYRKAVVYLKAKGVF